MATPAPRPVASFDGGTLDCGNGLLLLIRKHIDPLAAGELLEIRSREASVGEDLPAWCRLTGNTLVVHEREAGEHRFLVAKGGAASGAGAVNRPANGGIPSGPAAGAREATLGVAQPVPPREAPAPVAPLSVFGIGSWPRPGWMLRALHEHLERRASEAEFAEAAGDAVKLAIQAQERAGVDLITDGEQWRDNYASFVGGLLENCQLVPIVDLLAYVDDPEEFREQLRSLDVPAQRVRHPAVLGKIRRGRPLAVHELELARGLTSTPVKVALPGPYLLTRTMWMDCLRDRAYATRDDLARDLVGVLREEVAALLAAGAAVVQLDEPVLSDVAFGAAGGRRTFMCGALGEKRAPAEEFAFAEGLLQEVCAGFPPERLALHVCRGNWSPDEGVALRGDYGPLVGVLSRVPVGMLFLELCTPRAGELEALAGLPSDRRVGVGVVNQKRTEVEGVEEIVARAEAAIRMFGAERVLLHPDCGFATFADNPIASAAVAERKLAAMAAAARRLRERYRR